MYSEHFGLTSLPFNVNPDRQFSFISSGFIQARESVLRAPFAGEVVQVDVTWPGQASYLLRRGTTPPDDVARPTNVLGRLRDFQRLASLQAIARKQTYGAVLKARKRVHRKRMSVLRKLRGQ